MAAAPPGAEEDIKDGVEVCMFDESADGFSRTVRAISELVDKVPKPDFPKAEVERLSSSITFLREWRHFSYEPKNISFTNGTESTSSRDDLHSVTLPQFSSASAPQITPKAGAIISASPTKENDGTWNSKGGESPKELKVIPPNSVALHRVRWNMNKGSERWLCYGGAAGIIRCQRI